MQDSPPYTSISSMGRLPITALSAYKGAGAYVAINNPQRYQQRSGGYFAWNALIHFKIIVNCEC